MMTEFGTSIEIITNVNGKLFLIPDNLSDLLSLDATQSAPLVIAEKSVL